MYAAKRPYFTLLAIGLLVHVAALAWLHVQSGGIDAHAFRSPDAREYYVLARNLARNGTFSQDDAPPLRPDTWRTPGYPLFLAMLMTFLGDAPGTLIVAQHALALGNVLLLFSIARPMFGPPRALAAALLFLLEPYRVLYAGWLLSPTFQVTVLLAAWGAWAAAMRGGTVGWFLLVGALTGGLVLIWPGYFGFLMLLFLAGALICGRENRRVRLSLCSRRLSWMAPPVLLVAGLAVVFPWVQRNRQIGGTYALSSQSGIVLAYFKAAEVVLWRQGGARDRYLALSTDPEHADFPHATWDAIDRELRGRLTDVDDAQRESIHWSRLAQGNRSAVDSFRISRELTVIAWEHLLESPSATLTCYAVRIFDQLTFPLSLAWLPPAGVEVRAIRNVAIGLPYTLLGVFVVVRLVRRNMPWSVTAFGLAAVLAVLLVAAPQIDPRFRVPMIPFLLTMALLPVNRSRYLNGGDGTNM